MEQHRQLSKNHDAFIEQLKITMDKNTLIELVGAEYYAEEAQKARSLAPFVGGPNLDRIYDSDLPYTLSKYIWEESDLNDYERIQLIAQVYQDIPCYALLAEVYLFHYRDMRPDLRREYLECLYSLLASGDEALIQPIIYNLAMDIFDSSDLVNEAWTILVKDYSDIAVMQLLFPISSSVPYALKEQAYHATLHIPELHRAIFDSLYGSSFFMLGEIEPAQALKLLPQLQLDRTSEKYQKLYSVLQTKAKQ